MNNVYASYEVIERLQAIGLDPVKIIKEIANMVDSQQKSDQDIQDVITYQEKTGACTIEIEVIEDYEMVLMLS